MAEKGRRKVKINKNLTELMKASGGGNISLVRNLLSGITPISVNKTNVKGNSAVWFACQSGHLEIAKLLFEEGADMDSRNKKNISCLEIAARNGHIHMVDWMVEHIRQFPSDTELNRTNINGENAEECKSFIVEAKEKADKAAKELASIEFDFPIDRDEKKSKKEKKKEMKKKKQLMKKGIVKEMENKDSSSSTESSGSPLEQFGARPKHQEQKQSTMASPKITKKTSQPTESSGSPLEQFGAQPKHQEQKQSTMASPYRTKKTYQPTGPLLGTPEEIETTTNLPVKDNNIFELRVPTDAGETSQRSASQGSVCHMPALPGRNGRRHIIIDGSNVALRLSNGQYYDCKSVKLSVDFFKNLGHTGRIMVSVPKWRFYKTRSRQYPIHCQYILEELQKESVVLCIPAGIKNGKRAIIDYANAMDGVIISNDKFREFKGISDNINKILENRLLPFILTKNEDMYFSVPSDPFGKCGQSRDSILMKKM